MHKPLMVKALIHTINCAYFIFLKRPMLARIFVYTYFISIGRHVKIKIICAILPPSGLGLMYQFNSFH